MFASMNEAGDRVIHATICDSPDKCETEEKSGYFPHRSRNYALWARCGKEKKSFASDGPFDIPEGHIPIIRAMAVAIIHREEVIGNLTVSNKSTDYTDSDMKLLETIADHIAPILYARMKAQQAG
nr:GAF domain-containing protein [Desulfonema ishimotonii]